MNLKLVVASMSILGLVSCPVFAATTDAKETNHNNHHKMKHHRMVKEEREHERERHVRYREREHEDEHEYRSYKDMGPMPCAPEVCVVSQETMLLDEMTQNKGRAIPN